MAKQIISARLEPTKYLLTQCVELVSSSSFSVVFSPDFWVANRQTNGEENIADNPVDATVTKRGHGIENLGYKIDFSKIILREIEFRKMKKTYKPKK